MLNNLKKTVIDERTGWEYELNGDYYYPTGRVQRNGMIMPDKVPEDNESETDKHPMGIWGQRHLNYIRQHKKSLYIDLFFSGKLNAYLADLNEQTKICIPVL